MFSQSVFERELMSSYGRVEKIINLDTNCYTKPQQFILPRKNETAEEKKKRLDYNFESVMIKFKNHKYAGKMDDDFLAYLNNIANNYLRLGARSNIFDISSLLSYTCNDPQLFDKITDTIKLISDDSIIVYVPDIKKYCVLTGVQYVDFMKECEKLKGPNDEMTYYDLKQVILNNGKQKLVILCNSETVMKVQQLAKVYFSSDNITSQRNAENEFDIVMHDKLYNNRDEAFEIFNSFCENISNDEIKKTIKFPQLIEEDGIKFTLNNIGKNWTSSQYNTRELLRSLNLDNAQIIIIDNRTINDNTVTITGNDNTVNHSTITNKNTAKNKKDLAITWAKDNPPQNGELLTHYYDRYAKSGINSTQLLPSRKFHYTTEEIVSINMIKEGTTNNRVFRNK